MPARGHHRGAVVCTASGWGRPPRYATGSSTAHESAARLRRSLGFILAPLLLLEYMPCLLAEDEPCPHRSYDRHGRMADTCACGK